MKALCIPHWSLALAILWSSLAIPQTRGAQGVEPTKPDSQRSVRILVAYHSLTGNTEPMAKGVAEGVKRVPGAAAFLKRIEEVTKPDLESADGIVLGGPAYYGNIPGKMKTAMDDWSWKMKVDFTDKAGGAFATGGGQADGKLDWFALETIDAGTPPSLTNWRMLEYPLRAFAGKTVGLVVKVAYGGPKGVFNEEAFFDEISVLGR
jgi:multimeric flavodoxin WrbA